MIVICEECGKKYRIDPAKIKGKAASFKCRVCAHPIVVSKPMAPPPKPAAAQTEARPRATSESIATRTDDGSTTGISDTSAEKPASGTTEKQGPRKSGRFGLRAKMVLWFLIIPMMLVAGAGLLYLLQFETTVNLLSRESAKVVNRLAEEKIANIAAAVAKQCKLYLQSHPELSEENFNDDKGFRSLAVQKVGLKGYTSLYQLPDSDGIWRTWAHINPKIVAIDMSTLKKSLGKNFPGFWKIFSGVKSGKKTQGYYTWRDKDGKFRDKFMACTPIAATRYVIAATLYMDELTEPVRMMKSNAKGLVDQARMITLAALASTLLLIGLVVSIYGHRLRARIKSLAEVADRISVGELDMKIDTKSKDEIGQLAEAIAGMQNSIRLTIARLRRRR